MSDCVFCSIVAGESEASLVHEDELALVAMDISPVNEGHALVIPREHAPSLADLDDELGAHLFHLAQRTARAAYASGLRCEGVNLFLADGVAAGQEVFHAHLHVLPRYAGDPFRIDREGGWAEASRGELDRVAATLSEVFA